MVTRSTSRWRATSCAGSSTHGTSRAVSVVAVEDEAHLDLRRRIADAHAQQEAIELRLGQREGAAKSCGFCVAMTKNGSGSGMVCPSSETCPSFIASSSADCVRGLARLISSARSTLAKMGPWRRTNSPRALVVDADAEDVARQEVARELHAPQLAADGLGERARERRLADARDVLDEQVAARQERDERELDGVVLALERALDGLTQRLERRELLGDAGGSSRHEAQSSMAARTRARGDVGA